MLTVAWSIPCSPFGRISPAAGRPGRSSAQGPTFCCSVTAAPRQGPQRQNPAYLLPFGRISPATKPGLTGRRAPPFGFCRAKSRAAFRCAKPPCAVVRFAAHGFATRTACFAVSSRLRASSKTPACSRPVAFRLRRNRLQPVSAPLLLGLPRKSNRARHFAAQKPPCAVVRFAAMASPPAPLVFAVPVTAAPRQGPQTAKPRHSPSGRISPAGETGLTGHRPHRGRRFALPRHGCAARANGKTDLLPFGRILPAAKPKAGRSSAPQGPTFCRSRHGCAAPGAQQQNPTCSRSVAFRLRRQKPGLTGRCPPPGQRAHSIFASLKCGPALAPRPCLHSVCVRPSFRRIFRRKCPPPSHAFAFAAGKKSLCFTARAPAFRHHCGGNGAPPSWSALRYTLPAFLNAPDSSTTALVLPFAKLSASGRIVC